MGATRRNRRVGRKRWRGRRFMGEECGRLLIGKAAADAQDLLLRGGGKAGVRTAKIRNSVFFPSLASFCVVTFLQFFQSGPGDSGGGAVRVSMVGR
jgi:hypothetical protein